MNRSFFFNLAVIRTRSRPAVTPSRLGVRSVLGSNAFPSAPSLRSTSSAADRSALFTGLIATLEGSELLVIVRHRLRLRLPPSRCGPLTQAADRETSRFPYKERLDVLGSSTAPDRLMARANATLRVAFRSLNNVGIRNVISWLNTQPGDSPVNASWPPSPTVPHA